MFFRRACTAEGVNSIDATGESNTTGPIVYLLKLLMRQSGISCLKKAVEKYHWVVPMELCRPEVSRGGGGWGGRDRSCIMIIG